MKFSQKSNIEMKFSERKKKNRIIRTLNKLTINSETELTET